MQELLFLPIFSKATHWYKIKWLVASFHAQPAINYEGESLLKVEMTLISNDILQLS